MTNAVVLETEFGDLEKLVYKLVHSFCRKTGTAFDEALSEAGTLFCKHYETYNGSTQLSTWMYWKIRCGLIDSWRAKQRQAKRFQTGLLPEKSTIDNEPFSWEDWCRELSLDAEVVVELLTETFSDVDNAPTNAKKRSCLRGILLSWGWSRKRIREVFAEIKEALEC